MTLLNEKEAAIFLGCSIHKMQRDRRKGSPVRFVKIGSSVKYRMSDLENYIQSQTFNSTSEYGGGGVFVQRTVSGDRPASLSLSQKNKPTNLASL